MHQEKHSKCIYLIPIHGYTFLKVWERLRKIYFYTLHQDIFLSSLVLYELQVGMAKSNNPQKREKQLATLLEQIHVVYFTEREAKASALLRAELEKKGTPIGPIDILIAGTAKAHNLTLVTHNTKEFMRVDGIALDDWF